MKNILLFDIQNIFYSAFGSVIKDRAFEDFKNFRYKFNGKESDGEINGEGNSYDYGNRIYDPRLARFLSIDSQTHKYAAWSPYNSSANNPIHNIDIDGDNAIGYIGADGKLYIQATYVAVSEGEQSYTDAERSQIQTTLNNFWKTSVGMHVTMADGKDVEIGGVEISVVAGGDLLSSSSKVAGKENFENNLLIKSEPEEIKDIMESEGQVFDENVGGITTKSQTSDTYNETHISSETTNGKIAERVGLDSKKNENNTYIDESGHILGTSHPGPNDDPKTFGALETGETDDGKLLLNSTDMQHIVNSKELKIVDKPKPK